MSKLLENWKELGSYLHLEHSGHKIYIQQRGKPEASAAKTLLLFHGFPESSFSYHKVIDGLSKAYEQVVMLDFLGFGFSDKPKQHNYSLLEQADIALAVWKHFGLTGGHLIAHDMGDSVATELLARMVEGKLPEWWNPGLQSVTFTNGNMVMKKAKLRILQQLLRWPYLGAVLARLSRFPMFRHQVKSASGSDFLQEKDIERMWALINHNDGRQISHLLIRYLNERDKYQNTRWLPSLSKVKIPIYICWGDQDQVAPIAVAEHLKEHNCPQATLRKMEGLGHFAQQEHPEKWLQAVLQMP